MSEANAAKPKAQAYKVTPAPLRYYKDSPRYRESDIVPQKTRFLEDFRGSHVMNAAPSKAELLRIYCVSGAIA